MLRSPFLWVGLLAVLVLAGPRVCSTPPAEVAEAPPPVKAPPSDAPWSPKGAGAIVSVSPERLRTDGRSVAPQSIDVAYRIRQPEEVTAAWLELEIETVGEIARLDVPIQASGSVRFDMMPRRHSLGPHVRFRAACPQGTTEWYSLGTQPPTLPAAPAADVLRIDNVSPRSIPLPVVPDGHGGAHLKQGGARVSISGKQLTADCRIDADVNGSSVELHGLRHTGRRFEGLLYYEDLNHDAVAPRYASLQLVVKRPGSRMAAVHAMAID